MIRAALFDMDGLLVDSEPHWRAVERDIFASVGLLLTDDECKRTTGMPILDVVRYWHARAPWSDEAAGGRSDEQLADEITEAVHDRIARLAEPMPGAIEALTFFARQGLPVAIASASPMSLIEVVVDRLHLRPYLTLWHSATLEARNKPAPDVYLGAAHRLGVAPADCVAFEDSGAGLRSAHSAGMRTVAVPAAFEAQDPKFHLADVLLSSLTEFSAATLARLQPSKMHS